MKLINQIKTLPPTVKYGLAIGAGALGAKACDHYPERHATRTCQASKFTANTLTVKMLQEIALLFQNAAKKGNSNEEGKNFIKLLAPETKDINIKLGDDSSAYVVFNNSGNKHQISIGSWVLRRTAPPELKLENHKRILLNAPFTKEILVDIPALRYVTDPATAAAVQYKLGHRLSLNASYNDTHGAGTHQEVFGD